MSFFSPKYRFSKDCYSFGKKSFETRLEKNPDDDDAHDMVQYYEQLHKDDIEKQHTDEFKKSLEYALRTSDTLCDKVVNDTYAQNLYAALCNNDFIKDGITCFYSWRAAGRIVANMREQGDYFDWYCSGIIPDEDTNISKETKERFKNYVSEGLVTSEVKSDIESLGWKIFGAYNAELSNT